MGWVNELGFFTVKNLTKESFQRALNDTFVLRANPTQSLNLQLVAINDLSVRFGNAKNSERTPFSLHFRGPTTPWAQQHTYRLENAQVGAVDIFLVPVGPDPQGMLYEAVFG